MNFSKPFQTGCIRVIFVSVEKYHKSIDFFLSYFSVHQAFEAAAQEFSRILRKLTGKNKHDEV